MRALALIMVAYVGARIWWLSPVDAYWAPVVTKPPDIIATATDTIVAGSLQIGEALLPAPLAASERDVALVDALLGARQLTPRSRAAIMTRIDRQFGFADASSTTSQPPDATSDASSRSQSIAGATSAVQAAAFSTAANIDPLPAFSVGPGSNRFSGSAFMLIRDGGGATLAPGGLLGGNQAGFRLFYEPGPRGVFATVRVSAPSSSIPGKELAIGAGIRGRNAGLIVEQRLALDSGQPSDLAAIAYGGVYDVPVAAGFKFDGYAQAGIVGVRRQALFIDGAARFERPVAQGPGWRLGVGAGAWGGAQPGVARLDIGPQVVARIAAGTIRIGGEWRFRVAGDASPASGPALTVGMDF